MLRAGSQVSSSHHFQVGSWPLADDVRCSDSQAIAAGLACSLPLFSLHSDNCHCRLSKGLAAAACSTAGAARPSAATSGAAACCRPKGPQPAASVLHRRSQQHHRLKLLQACLQRCNPPQVSACCEHATRRMRSHSAAPPCAAKWDRQSQRLRAVARCRGAAAQ